MWLESYDNGIEMGDKTPSFIINS